MASLSKILFPLAVTAFVSVSAMNFSPSASLKSSPDPSFAQDTVIYPPYNYRPKSQRSEAFVPDSTFVEVEEAQVALADSLTLSPARDSLKALLDSSLWDIFEPLFISDSLTQVAAADAIWYGGLSKQERKRYDKEQEEKLKMAVQDSIRKVKERKKEIADSILLDKPRILETYALADTMQYKRIVSWTLDDDFGDMEVSIPDTTFNAHFYDYKFQTKDVNATWLGMAGSPVQYYNFSKRKSDEGVDFYNALEPWSYSPRSLPHYNTKTPYTELAYWGTLFATRSKTSENIHLFTTQNITPELNFSILIDNFGGEGMLENEKSRNSNTVFQTNYLGKKYTMHAGYIGNDVERGENGGISETKWITDTIVDSRDIPILLKKANSKVKKHTFFLDQQLRIPFNFINRLKAKKDSTFVFNPDSLDRDISSAFIGHSSEISNYSRSYIGDTQLFDSLRVSKLDNKLYIRLQPWSSEAIVGKLDVGIGDLLVNYLDTTATKNYHRENSIYLYAGASGQFKGNFFWNAKASYTLLGANFGDLAIEANGKLNFYPFRRHKKSPLSLSAHFETTLQEATWYNKSLKTNQFEWQNDFSKISTTLLSGKAYIPHWKLEGEVAYTLLANNLYYDTKSIIRQNSKAMSVLSAYLRKEFVFGPVHLDNKALFQLSSNPEVLPLPELALNLRYYLEFVAARSPRDNKTTVLTMQIGTNIFWNTKWNSPAWNPDLGVFYNQNERLYNNGPIFDIFLNMQWKRATIFVKYQNGLAGIFPKSSDFFSADRYTVTRNGMDGLKIGIFWPFYKEPTGSQ